jgi:hypothetical protein
MVKDRKVERLMAKAIEVRLTDVEGIHDLIDRLVDVVDTGVDVVETYAKVDSSRDEFEDAITGLTLSILDLNEYITKKMKR